MRNKKLLTIVPLILTALVVASPASAQKQIPGIKKTAQWTSLLSYVDVLEGRKNTPASATQKTAFRQRLATKKTAADTRVKSLYANRLQQIINRDQRNERRQIKTIRQNQARQVAELQQSETSRLALAQGAYNEAVDKITARFAGRLNSEVKNRKKLQRNLRRTTDPIERQLILARLDTVNNEIRQQKRARQNAYDRQAADYKTKVSYIQDRYATRIANSKRYYKSLVRKAQQAWKVIFDDQVAALKQRRTTEFGLVRNLGNRGSGYIDQMPSPPIR